MTQEHGREHREVEHEITVSAPAAAVYRLIAEVEHWPRIFPPTIHVERLEGGATEERIRIWATANGTAKSWTSRRTLDAGALRVGFRQEVSAPPVAAMGGTWIIEPLSDTECRVRLLHDYRAVDDDPASLRWIDEAVDGNSRSELAALKTNVEAAHAAEELTFSFEDTVQINGSAKDVYDFINEAGRWRERLPHVATVRLEELSPGLQTLEMDTRAKDGSTHTTKSYRVCLPVQKIAYKQVTLPALMTLHTGYWTFEENEDGVAASSQHTVVLNTANIARVLGAEATVDDAREYVRAALSTNSRATLGHARTYAESRS
ncbi:aromatase/cyclase [Actinocorallia sp. API 0066]|uniref:aromatase/cyclase n=1 Tax=Actinocorallia sp. API 0066 TaxID=2896846 RepID=UPI001E5BE05B|nr:aromatase/cyclase [Actinocorallia sp. API 0066]MCD0452141.1 aromatase/cyclase [Actinocorallia sp. API 0066]